MVFWRKADSQSVYIRPGRAQGVISGLEVRVRTLLPVPTIGKPDFHVSEHRKPFNMILSAAKTNQLLSQNPRQPGWGSVD